MKKKRMFTALIATLLALVLSFALVACDNGGGSVTIQLSEEAVTVQEGKSVTLSATASDGSKITWTSENEAVAAVSDSGRVTGKSKGVTTVTAASGKAKAVCTVTVTEAIKVTINETALTLAPNETKQLTASSSDNTAITWSSNKESVATVSADGLVTAIAEGSARITATSASGAAADCVVTVKDPNLTEIEFAGESDAVKTPNTFFYWTEFAEVTTKTYGYGTATFAFSNNAGQWYNFQIFYKDDSLESGKKYSVSFDFNSTAAGHISVNGVVKEIAVGDNKISVDAIGSNASLSIQIGRQNAGIDIEEATVKISNLKFEEFVPAPLAAPTALVIADDKTVTVTDENADKADGYRLIFFQDGVRKSAVVVKNGEKLNDSAVPDGAYKVHVQAVGSGRWLDSEIFAADIDYTVANGGISYEITGGGAEAAAATPGKFFYWHESWVIITDAKFENDIASLAFENNAGNWYDTQIFYVDGSLDADKHYTVSLVLDVTTAGHVTVNDKVFELTEGENAISVDKLGSNASLAIILGYSTGGNPDMKNGTIKIKNLEFTEFVPEKLAAPTAITIDNDKVVTITDENAGKAGGYKVAFYKDGQKKYEVTLNSGDTLNDLRFENGEYSVKVTAVGTGKYADSDEFDAQITHTVNNGAISYDIVFGENKADGNVITTPDTFYYWNDQNWNGATVAASNAKYENGAATLSYEYTAGSSGFGFQIFYKSTQNETGKTYKLSFKINVTNAMSLGINGQTVTLTAGDNTVEVTYTETQLASLSMQCGNSGDNDGLNSNTVVISEVAFTEQAAA